jgi:hypothetical protein
VVPLDENLKFHTGEQVLLTGYYRDQHGCVVEYDALDLFAGCSGEMAVWRYLMVPPTSEGAPCVA